MSSTYHQIYVHLSWSTWDRVPLIDPVRERLVFPEMAWQCAQLGCEALAIDGVADHVHLLLDLHPKANVSDLVRAVKSTSSNRINQVFGDQGRFAWQGGYSALSVNPDGVPRVLDYVRKQKKHHAEGTLDAALEARPTFGE